MKRKQATPPAGMTKKEQERLQRELRFLGYRSLAGRLTYDDRDRMAEIKAKLEGKEQESV